MNRLATPSPVDAAGDAAQRCRAELKSGRAALRAAF
jgi:hypothetical protein